MKTLALLTAGLIATSAALTAAEAQENWDTNCASCHGKDGKGATRSGRIAGVKDMTDAAYQKEFTDEEAFAQIKDGLKDEKTGKEKMKAFGEKLNDDEINALIAYVRALAK